MIVALLQQFGFSVADLLAAMEAEMLELYADSMGAMPPAGPADFTPPGGAYLVGFVDGEPVSASCHAAAAR